MKCSICKMNNVEIAIYEYTERSGDRGYIVGTSFPGVCETLLSHGVDFIRVEEFDKPWLQECIYE